VSKRHPNNGPTFSDAAPKKRKRPPRADDPSLDPSRPEKWIPPKVRDAIAEAVERKRKEPEVAGKWTTGKP
jgi:hypothetical protein